MNFERISELAERQVSSQKALDDATAARDQARATLQGAEAEVATARLNVEYSVIKAPLAGPTSLTSPPEGALIQPQSTLLTTITQLDPAYVNFTITDEELRRFQSLNEERAAPLRPELLEVQLQFGDGKTYPQLGKLDNRSRSVDPQTGTIQIRAVFPNDANRLLPGQFVRINVRGMTVPNAILVPRAAVSQGPQGPFVYVVGSNSDAQVRPVVLDQEIDKGWIVRSGLKSGERIVVDGIIRVRPGAILKPVAPSAPAAAAPAAPGSPPTAAGAKP